MEVVNLGFFTKLHKTIVEKEGSEQIFKEIEEKGVASLLDYERIMESINEYKTKAELHSEQLLKETELSKETGNIEN